MTTSPDLVAGSGPVGGFVNELRSLTTEQLAAVAHRVGDARATAADNVEWWLATAAVGRDLRRLHRERAAAIAFRQASEAVLAAPGAAQLPHEELVHAARAAGEVAGALVAGRPPAAVAVIARGWEELLPAAGRPPHPAAA